MKKALLITAILGTMAGAVYSGIVASDKKISFQNLLIIGDSASVGAYYIVAVNDLDGSPLTKRGYVEFNSAYASLIRAEALAIINGKEGK